MEMNSQRRKDLLLCFLSPCNIWREEYYCFKLFLSFGLLLSEKFHIAGGSCQTDWTCWRDQCSGKFS